MQFDALGNITFNMDKLGGPVEEFERKMHFIGLYNKAISDLVAEDPKISKKDFYLKSQELQKTFLAASKGKDVAKPAKTKSPFPEYPDAFYEKGEWRVIQNGHKYRVRE
jgi:hypothetical protein